MIFGFTYDLYLVSGVQTAQVVCSWCSSWSSQVLASCTALHRFFSPIGHASFWPALHYALLKMSKHFYSFTFQFELVSNVISCKQSTVCVLCGLCFQLYHHTVTRKLLCCRSVKQTILIAWIQQQFDRIWEHATSDFLSSIPPAWGTHACASNLLTPLICTTLPRWQVSHSSVHHLYVCLFLFLSCSIFMPFLFNLHMPTWGKRPYHRVGINELPCCAQTA